MSDPCGQSDLAVGTAHYHSHSAENTRGMLCGSLGHQVPGCSVKTIMGSGGT